MFTGNKIWIASNEKRLYLMPRMANRHGIVSGATGTGKTITLKVLAESFSEAGVPVFVSDVKGDLSGMGAPGKDSEDMQKRIEKFGLAEEGFEYRAFPTRYWDVYGEKGLPVRATVMEMGPLLISRILGLNETQEGVMSIIFRVADDEGMLLLDFKDLRAMVQYVGENAKNYRMKYGNISASSIGAIQRGLLRLEDQGAELFFGEPSLDIYDWMTGDAEGRGYINVMNCEKLFLNPTLYGAFMLFMLSEIYETLPEVGDLDKPKMALFFDEAHLIFKDASKELMDKVEQVIRLIRSKGVGVFFITQNPTDIPETVLGQLGNRIQHALRAYSVKELRGVKTAAETFRVNPEIDAVKAIQELGTGEALVQFLDEKGIPLMVERANILPPQSLMGPLPPADMMNIIASDDMCDKYLDPVDRESAYEILNATALEAAAAEEERLASIAAEKAQRAADKEAAELAKAEAAKKREEEQLALAKARLEAQKKREEERAAAAAAKAEAAAKREEERAAAAKLKAEIAERKEKERQEKEEKKEKEKTAKMLQSIAVSGARSFTTTMASSFARGILGSLKK
ncbi:MAG: DUF853 domain-containing protein [Lachnospiraceae bacterium]|nr:DUF853 domain-containing protein [Lachnospiraceae bacterium]